MQTLRSVRPTLWRACAGGVLASLVAVLVFAAVAGAAKPKHNARFSGFSSAPPVVGFKAPVTFKVAANGLSLSNFSFGSFGCFGAGGFRPGVNPYTHSLIDIGKLKVSAAGKVAATGTSTMTAAGTTTKYIVRVTVRFSSSKKASGTISFTEENSSGSFHASCKGDPRTFTAKAR